MRKFTPFNPFTLPAAAARLVFPASAALLAALALVTFAVALATGGMQRGGAVALTEGGKFAVRIAGAAPATVDGIAQAGQDAALPVLLHPEELAAVHWLSILPAEEGAGDAERSKPALVEARVAVPSMRPIRARAAGAASAAPRMPVIAATTSPNALDDGLVGRMAAATRAVWSVASSAGEAVVSRILPQ